jgi:hypothetical protein
LAEDKVEDLEARLSEAREESQRNAEELQRALWKASTGSPTRHAGSGRA